jgi:hypothetical protein
MNARIATHAGKLMATSIVAPVFGSSTWLKAVQIAIRILKMIFTMKRRWDRFMANLTTEERARGTELLLRAKDRENPLNRDEQREIVRLACKALGIDWGDDDGMAAPVAA